jgi:gluconolactonase
VAELGGGPNGVAVDPGGTAYVVNNGGFLWTSYEGRLFPIGPEGTNAPPEFEHGWVDRVNTVTGTVERLYEGCDGVGFAGPNDIVLDDHGGFWFTDFGKIRTRTVDRGAIYYARCDGSSVICAATNLFGPNGIGLSADGRSLYVAETYTGRLLRWNVSEPGVLSGGGAVLLATPEHLDSLAVAPDGTVVLGALRGLCVVRPDLDWQLIELPDPMVTNICFSSSDPSAAYVTLSATGRLIRLEWPSLGLMLRDRRSLS